jgi:hypothetical protein
LQEITIKDYFKDPEGRLSRFRKDLIHPAGKNGKYYLKTDAG